MEFHESLSGSVAEWQNLSGKTIPGDEELKKNLTTMDHNVALLGIIVELLLCVL